MHGLVRRQAVDRSAEGVVRVQRRPSARSIGFGGEVAVAVVVQIVVPTFGDRLSKSAHQRAPNQQSGRDSERHLPWRANIPLPRSLDRRTPRLPPNWKISHIHERGVMLQEVRYVNETNVRCMIFGPGKELPVALVIVNHQENVTPAVGYLRTREDSEIRI
jgi:hypothetical protein